MKNRKFPSISKDLIEALKELWPDRLPDDACISIEKIAESIGSVKVIRFLEQRYEEQTKNILGD